MTTVGTRIRSIRLVERLGGGGMGEVFVGIDERLDRRVAVKAIRPGRQPDAEARSRFAREARMLSRLEHPAICRLYEFIEEPDGDYLVMELLSGTTLDEAAARGLSHDHKLAIAERVAEALVAAHAMSVIHRDLKPANVIITEDGDTKVLDFGLARTAPEDGASVHATASSPPGDAAGDDVTSVTLGGDLLGTPRYMSPEQVAGRPATAASDMYSFGLLLQEIFSGRSAYDEGLTRDELLHKARWADIRPLTGVDRDLASLIEDLTSLRAEDRPTATTARDRLRWIRDRPGRLLRRAAVTTVAASLLLAVLGLGAGWHRARSALTDSEHARAQADAVNRFLRGMLESPDPRQRGADVRVVDVLDRAAIEVPRTLGDDPAIRAAVLDAIGSTYHALGSYRSARPHLEEALDLRRETLGRDAPDTLTSADHLGRLLADQGELEEAEEMLRATLAAREEVLGAGHRDVATSLRSLATILELRGDYDEASAALGEAIERLRAEVGPDHPDVLATETTLALVKARQGKYSEAAGLQRRTLAAKRRVLGELHPDTLGSLGDLAVSVTQMGDYAAAEGLMSATVDGRTRALGATHPATLTARSNLAQVLRLEGRLDDAEALSREVLELRTEVLGPDHIDTLASTGNLAVVKVRQGKLREAAVLLEQAWRTAERALGEDHPQTLMWMSNLAAVLRRQHRLDRAEALVRECIARRTRTIGAEHPDTLISMETLADVLDLAGRPDEAEAVHRSLIETSIRVIGPDHPKTLKRVERLAALLRRTGRETEAAALEAGAGASAVSSPSTP